MIQYLQKHQSIHRQIQRQSTISFIYLLIGIRFLNPFIKVLTLTTQTFQYCILLIENYNAFFSTGWTWTKTTSSAFYDFLKWPGTDSQYLNIFIGIIEWKLLCMTLISLGLKRNKNHLPQHISKFSYLTHVWEVRVCGFRAHSFLLYLLLLYCR